MNQSHSVADKISDALRKRKQQLGLTATFKTDPRIFAENAQLRKLDSPDWQIVFGRRGAGKTMLLATYAQYITINDKSKYASIEINATDFTSDVRTDSPKKPKDIDVAQIYFADFMRYISDHLFKVFSEANKDSKFWRFSQTSQKRHLIESLVIRIKESTVEQNPSQIGQNRKIKTKRKGIIEHKNKSGIDLNASLGADLSGDLSAGADAKLSYGHGDSRITTDTLEEDLGISNFKFDYYRTRKLLEELLEVLGLEKLYIFIDEWSEIDPTASTNIQPYFAALLKRVFWKNHRFIIKIGAIRNQTRLLKSTRGSGSIGLELSADLFELSLDSVYAGDEVSRAEFFENLIFRHLSYCNPDIKGFQRQEEVTLYGTIKGEPIDTFITYIFKTRDVFKTLVIGAGALPRDFIEMFDAIAESRRFSVQPPWSLPDIKKAVKNHYINNKHATLDSDGDIQDYCDKITLKVIENGSRLILVNRRAEKKVLINFAQLYHKRLIHDVSSADIPPLLRNKFHFYYSDLGLFYDASREKYEEQTDHVENCPLKGNERIEDVAKFVVS